MSSASFSCGFLLPQSRVPTVPRCWGPWKLEMISRFSPSKQLVNPLENRQATHSSRHHELCPVGVPSGLEAFGRAHSSRHHGRRCPVHRGFLR